jgi:transcriptional regulator with XRE-family HTH domain
MARARNGDRRNENAAALGGAVQRLRKAREMSLGDLSEVSGVAKSIISQIERNETNPTIATVLKLADALGVSPEQLLARAAAQPAIIQHQKRADIPVLFSEDGKCRLFIIGALELVEHVQWYDFHAEPGGVLASDPHQPGCTEHLHVLRGEIEVACGVETRRVRAGESLRYRGDLPHVLRNVGNEPAHATMVLIMHPLG